MPSRSSVWLRGFRWPVWGLLRWQQRSWLRTGPPTASRPRVFFRADAGPTQSILFPRLPYGHSLCPPRNVLRLHDFCSCFGSRCLFATSARVDPRLFLRLPPLLRRPRFHRPRLRLYGSRHFLVGFRLTFVASCSRAQCAIGVSSRDASGAFGHSDASGLALAGTCKCIQVLLAQAIAASHASVHIWHKSCMRSPPRTCRDRLGSMRKHAYRWLYRTVANATSAAYLGTAGYTAG